jgi:hypothetical protein
VSGKTWACCNISLTPFACEQAPLSLRLESRLAYDLFRPLSPVLVGRAPPGAREWVLDQGRLMEPRFHPSLEPQAKRHGLAEEVVLYSRVRVDRPHLAFGAGAIDERVDGATPVTDGKQALGQWTRFSAAPLQVDVDRRAAKVVAMTASDAEDAVAWSKPSVADFNVEPSQQRGQRKPDRLLSLVDRIGRRRRKRERREPVNEPGFLGLEVLGRAAHIRAPVASEHATTREARARHPGKLVEILASRYEFLDRPDHLFLGYGGISRYAWICSRIVGSLIS